MTRRKEPKAVDLNLAPIMNVVVILIPMLLLAVVFLSVGVINISTPSLPSNTEPSDMIETPPTIAISTNGFIVQTQASTPTKIENQSKMEGRALTEAEVEKWVAAYDYDALYDVVETLPTSNGSFNVTADEQVPFAVVVRVMDAVRYKLDRSSSDSIWTAKKTGSLFANPTLALAR